MGELGEISAATITSETISAETDEIRVGSFGFSGPTRIDVRPAGPIAAWNGPRLSALTPASAASPDEAEPVDRTRWYASRNDLA